MRETFKQENEKMFCSAKGGSIIQCIGMLQSNLAAAYLQQERRDSWQESGLLLFIERQETGRDEKPIILLAELLTSKTELFNSARLENFDILFNTPNNLLTAVRFSSADAEDKAN